MVRDASGLWQVPAALALAGLAVGAFGATAATLPAVYVAAVTPELVRVDLRERRLPNRMVVPGLVVGLAACALAWSPLALVAAVAYAGFLWLLCLGGGVGMGDVKLAALLGLASPTLAVAVAAPVAAFVLGGVAASIVLALRGRGSRVAFGPWLLAGYWAALTPTMVSGSMTGWP